MADDRRLPDVRRGAPVRFTWNGSVMDACEGETIGAALLAAGCLTLRHTAPGGAPRGLFCGMGVCFDCLVTIDGHRQVRACLTPVRDQMVVTG